MSKDTIYREDALDEMERIMADHPLQGYEDELLLIDAIKSLPSADRPQGEWIVSDDKYFHTCQFCNAEVDVSMGTGIFVNNDEVSHMNFCPNCGAPMKGADDETN